jgi:hypothetical protein
VTDWTISRIYESIPEAELQELDASGDTVDNINWYWGRKAAEWIGRGFPSMLVYSAIGKRVGRGSSTIAQCYYTFKTFGNTETDERVPYSVYNHARQWVTPDEVVNYYLDHQCSVDEVETVFRVTESAEDRETFKATGFPRFFVGVWREMVGLPQDKYNQAVELLKEVLSVIGWKEFAE